MFFWPMAANAPSAIEAMATKTTICCHWVKMPGNATMVVRTTIVDIGRPHVERHRRNLEAETGEQEDQSEHQPQARGTSAPLACGVGDAGEAHRAREARDQRCTVTQHAGGQGAAHERFQPSLGAAHRITT